MTGYIASQRRSNSISWILTWQCPVYHIKYPLVHALRWQSHNAQETTAMLKRETPWKLKLPKEIKKKTPATPAAAMKPPALAGWKGSKRRKNNQSPMPRHALPCIPIKQEPIYVDNRCSLAQPMRKTPSSIIVNTDPALTIHNWERDGVYIPANQADGKERKRIGLRGHDHKSHMASSQLSHPSIDQIKRQPKGKYATPNASLMTARRPDNK